MTQTTGVRPFLFTLVAATLAVLTACTGGSDGVEIPTSPPDDPDVPCTNVVDRLEGEDLDVPRGALTFSANDVLTQLDVATGTLTPEAGQTPDTPLDLVVTVTPREPVVHLSETPPPAEPDRVCLPDRYVLEAEIAVEAFGPSADTGLSEPPVVFALTTTVELTAEAADRILVVGSGTPTTDWTPQTDASQVAIDAVLALDAEWSGQLAWSPTDEPLGSWVASP